MQPSLLKLFSSYHRLADMPIWLLVGFLRLISWLPLPLIYTLAVIIGEILYWSLTNRRRITLRNISACFPNKSPADHRKLARKHFHALIFAVLTTGVGWWASKKRLTRLTSIRHGEQYESLVSRGQNVIFLAPHFAALEYGGIFLSSQRNVVSMYQRNKVPLLDALIKDHRSRFGAIQYGSKEPIKSMIRHIRNGLPFYYLPDQDPGSKGVFAPFFNIPTATFPALGRIAGLGKASVIPTCTRILPWGRGFEIILLPSLENFPCDDEIIDTGKMNKAIEHLIAQAPAQYFWSHKRFKTRPEGVGSFY